MNQSKFNNLKSSKLLNQRKIENLSFNLQGLLPLTTLNRINWKTGSFAVLIKYTSSSPLILREYLHKTLVNYGPALFKCQWIESLYYILQVYISWAATI